MNMSYRKACKGEVTCEQCRHSKVRAVGGRLECQVSPDRYYVTGRKHTCDMAVQRGDK
jgi:Na+-transporting NADH:ubiquinone oxidoreductase subunit NqrF